MGSQRDYDLLRCKLNTSDRAVLESCKGIVDGIALFMGAHCEIALHSLENPENAIIKIANRHHTNREEGSPLTDHGIQLLKDFKEGRIAPTVSYTTMSASGEPMRSVFTIIQNKSKAIGLLGINFNMNIPLSDFISTFSLFEGVPQLGEGPYDSSANSVEDLVHRAVSGVVKQISTDTSIPNHEKNKYIVFGLYENGIFDIKGSVIMVAEELHLSKFTIYSYIRELKEKKS